MAYVLQTSLLSQERTSDLLERCGLRARVVDFAFLPFTDYLSRSAEHLSRVRADVRRPPSRVCGSEFMVGYLLEITRS